MTFVQRHSGLIGLIALAVGLAALGVGIVAIAQSDDDDLARLGAMPTPSGMATTLLQPTPDPVAEEEFARPSKGNVDEYTVWFVDQAISYYRQNGLAAAVARYSSADSVDGQWYAVIFDADRTVLAHYDNDLIGEHLEGPTGTDITGYDFGTAMAGADENGRWVSYVFRNPATGEQQLKHGWAVRSDGLIFLSGWYEFSPIANMSEDAPTADQPAEFTQAYVQQAIDMYIAEGREKTFERYGSEDSAVGRWYLFVIDKETDELVLHPNHALLGAKSAQRRDSRGYAYGAEMLKTTEEGQWVSYFYRTYGGDTPTEEGDKHTWLKLHDDLIFGSGWYENVAPLPTKAEDPGGYTQWFVQDAVDVYDVQGLDGLLEKYNGPGSVDGQWYVYVIGSDGTVLAHPTVKRLLGENVQGPAGVDLAGNRFGPEFLTVTEEGKWLPPYYFTNPVNDSCERKHSWAVRRGEVIIGSGWYEPPSPSPLLPSMCEKAHFTVATVHRAVERYRSEGYDATIAYHSSSQSVDGRWYTFIIDAETGELLAHPATSFIGYNLTMGSEAYDDAGYYYAADLMKATPEGIFVGNVISVPTVDEQNPFHAIEEVKHYYAVLEDGLIFSSGWYTPAPTPDDPSEYARLLVGRALTMYDDEGLDATLAHYNSPKNAEGPWYVFIIEDRGGVLYSVASANRPDLVGTTWERIDANGFNYGEAFIAVTEEGGGEWVSYSFTHPETGKDAPKHSWVVRRGNFLFGVGWYEGIDE